MISNLFTARGGHDDDRPVKAGHGDPRDLLPTPSAKVKAKITEFALDFTVERERIPTGRKPGVRAEKQDIFLNLAVPRPIEADRAGLAQRKRTCDAKGGGALLSGRRKHEHRDSAALRFASRVLEREPRRGPFLRHLLQRRRTLRGTGMEMLNDRPRVFPPSLDLA